MYSAVRDTDLVRAFIQKTSPIHPTTDGRIQIITANDKVNCGVAIPLKSSSATVYECLSVLVLLSTLSSVLLLQHSTIP